MNQETLERKDRLNMAALAVGYNLSWAGDDSLCWLDEPYDGRANTDDSWHPDGGWHDAFSLAATLGMHVSGHRCTAKHGPTLTSTIASSPVRLVMDRAGVPHNKRRRM